MKITVVLYTMPCLFEIYCHNFGRGFFCLLKGYSGKVLLPRNVEHRIITQMTSVYKFYAYSMLKLVMSAVQNVTLTLLTMHIDTKQRKLDLVQRHNYCYIN